MKKMSKSWLKVLCYPNHHTVVVKIRKWSHKTLERWGLFHEESVHRAYQQVVSHPHRKLKLVSKGFLISKSKPFLGASEDNIQKCTLKKLATQNF